MLIGHKTFYVKGGKEAFIGKYNVIIMKEDIQDTLSFFKYRTKYVLLETDELISYIIFFEDGKVGSGFLSKEELSSLQILTEEDLVIRDIIE